MIEETIEVSEDNSTMAPPEEGEEEFPEISFHAIAGTEHPQTIRVRGTLKNRELMILIDGGSTHNFIDQAVVTRFGLPMEQNKKFHVMVTNKEKIEYASQCQSVTVHVQGCPVKADFYVLPVVACPLVLGV